MAKHKVMVALRDPESAESLVALACQVASGMDAELLALHVVEIPMATPIEADDEVLDRPGKAVLALAQQCAETRFSRKISTRLLRARRAGEAIVGEAQEQGIECLVMGHQRRTMVGEILLGSNVQYVARHAPCRVIVEIPPLPSP
jgi:nucleotide-binding universal stress UspA family protein